MGCVCLLLRYGTWIAKWSVKPEDSHQDCGKCSSCCFMTKFGFTDHLVIQVSYPKFSRHLIIRIEKTAFMDNSHAGAFVTEICSRISSARERDGTFGNLFIRKDSSSSDSPSKLFVDTAVYT
ncbi:hypothetical protein ACFX2F_001966 [Malus domestica]